MPHIHTRPGDHDATASAYIIRIDETEPRVVLHMHKKYAKYMQFGGHIETNENPWQAMLREIAEETGYRPDQLKVLQPKSRIRHLTNSILHPQAVCQAMQPAGVEHFHDDTAYAFVTNELPVNLVSDSESKFVTWFTKKELLAMSKLTIFENVREMYIYILDECLKVWEQVDVSDFLIRDKFV